MNHVKAIVDDLVARRLWPVAAALVLALFAVPVVLSSDPEPVTTAAAPPPAAAPANVGPAVTAAGDAARSTLRGKAKDPFKQQNVPPADTGAVVTNNPTGAGITTPDGAGTPSVGTPGPTPGAGVTTPDGGPVKKSAVYDVFVRFGEATRTAKSKRVPRLSPLPSSSNPVAIFLGVLTDAKTAAFLVSSEATVQGDGTCKPSATTCTTLSLQEGEVAFLDVATADGGLQQYRMEVVSIEKASATSAKSSKTSPARISRAGQRLVRRDTRLRKAIRSLPVQFDQDSGTLAAVRQESSALGWLGAVISQVPVEMPADALWGEPAVAGQAAPPAPAASLPQP